MPYFYQQFIGQLLLEIRPHLLYEPGPERVRDYVRHGRRQNIIHAVHANGHGRRRAQVLKRQLHALLIWFDEEAVANGFWGWRTPNRDGMGEECFRYRTNILLSDLLPRSLVPPL